MCTSRGKIWLRVINRGITAIYVGRGNGQGPFQAPKSEVIYYKGYGKGICPPKYGLKNGTAFQVFPGLS